MLKTKYYCLIAGLPDLFFNESKPGFSSLDFRNELELQLVKEDFELIKLLFLPADNENLINILFDQNKPFNQNGIFPKNFLDPELENPFQLPLYMDDFIRLVNNQEQRELSLHYKNLLQHMFYDFLLRTKNQFLREWFNFELNVKNILTAINCMHFRYNPEQHLIQTETDLTVFPLLQKTQLKPEYFEELVPFSEQIFRAAASESQLIEKEKTIDKIKWDYLDEHTFFHYFTIEKVLSFSIKLLMTERWMKLDKKTGEELLNKLINELKTSYKFPAEFSL